MNPRLTHIVATQAHQELLRGVPGRRQRPITKRAPVTSAASVFAGRVRRGLAVRRQPRLAH
jgi:hypothetical protein